MFYAQISSSFSGNILHLPYDKFLPCPCHYSVHISYHFRVIALHLLQNKFLLVHRHHVGSSILQILYLLSVITMPLLYTNFLVVLTYLGAYFIFYFIYLFIFLSLRQIYFFHDYVCYFIFSDFPSICFASINKMCIIGFW